MLQMNEEVGYQGSSKGMGKHFLHFLRLISNVEYKELYGRVYVNKQEAYLTNLDGYLFPMTKQNAVDYMFECTLGRKFEKYEEVIHLDGNKLNIKPENLRIFCRQEWENASEFKVRYLDLCKARTIVQKKLAHKMPYKIVREQTIAMLHMRFPHLLLYEVLPARGNFSVTRTTWDKG